MKRKTYKNAVFFDIDGTLIELGGVGKMPPASAKEAIKKLQENDCLTIIATGRANAYIPDLGLDVDGFVSFNGAVVTVDGEVVFENAMSEDVTFRALEFFRSRNLDYLAETIDGCFFGGEADKNFYWIGNNVKPIEEYPYDIKTMRAAKISSPYDEEILRDFGAEFGEVLDFVPHRYDCFMDIGPKGITKATGINKILELYDIKRENSYAFGDDTNDLEMLMAVGHPVAMTPHADALEPVAEYITCAVSEDGIYKALKHYALV